MKRTLFISVISKKKSTEAALQKRFVAEKKISAPKYGHENAPPTVPLLAANICQMQTTIGGAYLVYLFLLFVVCCAACVSSKCAPAFALSPPTQHDRRAQKLQTLIQRLRPFRRRRPIFCSCSGPKI